MNKPARGFTLIELLVVISILGALAALTIISFSGQTRRARNVERKSDLRQYQTALESYANRSNGLYLVRNSNGTTAPSLCSALGLNGCPSDPSAGATNYQYKSNASGTAFVLWAFLENTPQNDVFVICSTGQVGEMQGSAFTGVNANATCPLP